MDSRSPLISAPPVESPATAARTPTFVSLQTAARFGVQSAFQNEDVVDIGAPPVPTLLRQGVSAPASFPPPDPLRHGLASGVSLKTLEQTFLCPLCCENVRESCRASFVDCTSADHACCRQCIGRWIRGLVADGRISGIVCPVGGCHCGAQASLEEVRQFTDNSVFDKCVRFRQMKANPLLRECPSCGVLCKPVEEDWELLPDMQCPECSTDFCYYHSNAHAGRSCGAYRLDVMRDEHLAMRPPCRHAVPPVPPLRLVAGTRTGLRGWPSSFLRSLM